LTRKLDEKNAVRDWPRQIAGDKFFRKAKKGRFERKIETGKIMNGGVHPRKSENC
jgi:hypothetical protein